MLSIIPWHQPLVFWLFSWLAGLSRRAAWKILVYIPRAGDSDPDLHAISPTPIGLTALVVAAGSVITSKGAVLCLEFVSEVPSDVAWHVGVPDAG